MQNTVKTALFTTIILLTFMVNINLHASYSASSSGTVKISDSASSRLIKGESGEKERSIHSPPKIVEKSFMQTYWAIIITGTIFILFLIFFTFKGGEILRKINMRRQVILTVSLLIILLIVISIFSVIKVNIIGNELKDITEQDLPLTDVITEITVNQLEQATLFERVVKNGEMVERVPEAASEIEHSSKAYMEHTKLINQEIEKGETIAKQAISRAESVQSRDEFEEVLNHLQTIKQRHVEYEEGVLHAVALVKAGQMDKVEELAREIEQKESELNLDLENFLRGVKQFTDDSVVIAHDEEIKTLIGILFISIAALLLGSMIGIILLKNMRQVVERIYGSAENVAAGSQEMSATAEQMAAGASEQAASAEEASASMEEMTANIIQSAENSQQTQKIAIRVADDAVKGGEAVKKTVEAMKQISDKITIIEEIARQTNMLALNAAIEAARAGEHGKGFAVVADAVRKLAERSQSAASEISNISSSSVEIAVQAGEMLAKIVPDIRKTADLVEEINASASEQKSGTEQINQAFQQLDQVIQSNAAASEEMSSTSEELASQAETLKGAISLLDNVTESGKKDTLSVFQESCENYNYPKKRVQHAGSVRKQQFETNKKIKPKQPETKTYLKGGKGGINIDMYDNELQTDRLDDEFEKY